MDLELETSCFWPRDFLQSINFLFARKTIAGEYFFLFYVAIPPFLLDLQFLFHKSTNINFPLSLINCLLCYLGILSTWIIKNSLISSLCLICLLNVFTIILLSSYWFIAFDFTDLWFPLKGFYSFLKLCWRLNAFIYNQWVHRLGLYQIAPQLGWSYWICVPKTPFWYFLNVCCYNTHTRDSMNYK